MDVIIVNHVCLLWTTILFTSWSFTESPVTNGTRTPETCVHRPWSVCEAAHISTLSSVLTQRRFWVENGGTMFLCGYGFLILDGGAATAAVHDQTWTCLDQHRPSLIWPIADPIRPILSSEQHICWLIPAPFKQANPTELLDVFQVLLDLHAV